VTITGDSDQPSTTLFHPYTIAVKYNVLVCIPKKDIKLTTLLYSTACLNMERWRFSYGRKCYKNKLNTLTIPFPIDDEGNIDQNKIEGILDSSKFEIVPKKTLEALQRIYWNIIFQVSITSQNRVTP